MKIEVNENPEPVKPEYPRLMEYQNIVVLFTRYGEGVVIKHPEYEVGHYSKSWVQRSFKPFNGSVTLSND